VRTSLHICAKVRGLIELSFGVVSGVRQETGVGVHVPQGEGAVLGFFVPIGLIGVFFNRNVCKKLVCAKLTIFLYGTVH